MAKKAQITFGGVDLSEKWTGKISADTPPDGTVADEAPKVVAPDSIKFTVKADVSWLRRLISALIHGRMHNTSDN